jgi:hypothetical protein
VFAAHRDSQRAAFDLRAARLGSRSQGVELGADYRWSRYASVSTDLAYLDARYLNFPDATCTALGNYLSANCVQNMSGHRSTIHGNPISQQTEYRKPRDETGGNCSVLLRVPPPLSERQLNPHAGRDAQRGLFVPENRSKFQRLRRAVSKNSRQINGLNSKLQGIDFNQKLPERTGLEPAEALAESAAY